MFSEWQGPVPTLVAHIHQDHDVAYRIALVEATRRHQESSVSLRFGFCPPSAYQ